jgi:hypothetical protein
MKVALPVFKSKRSTSSSSFSGCIIILRLVPSQSFEHTMQFVQTLRELRPEKAGGLRLKLSLEIFERRDRIAHDRLVGVGPKAPGLG